MSYKPMDQNYWQKLSSADRAWLNQFNQEYYLASRKSKKRILHIEGIRESDRTRKRIKQDLMYNDPEKLLSLDMVVSFDGEETSYIQNLSDDQALYFSDTETD